MKICMKRILSVVAILSLLLCLTACGKPTVSEYVEENGKMLEEQMEKALAASGMEFDCEVEARGNTLVVVMKSEAFDNFSATQKAQLQNQYDSMKGQMEEMVSSQKTAIKDIEGVLYEFCDSDGGIVAKIDIEF